MLRAFRVVFQHVTVLENGQVNPSAVHQQEVTEGQGESLSLAQFRLGTTQ